MEAEAAHGTVTRHYREHQKGRPTSTRCSGRAEPILKILPVEDVVRSPEQHENNSLCQGTLVTQKCVELGVPLECEDSLSKGKIVLEHRSDVRAGAIEIGTEEE